MNCYVAAFINTNSHFNVMRELKSRFPKNKFSFVNPMYNYDDDRVPFYGAYLFMKWEGEDSDYSKYEDKCPNIIRFLKESNNNISSTGLAYITDSEIEGLKKLEESEANYYDKYKEYEGRIVRFIEGVFRGYEGILKKTYPSRAMALVSVKLFGNRIIPADVSLDSIEIVGVDMNKNLEKIN